MAVSAFGITSNLNINSAYASTYAQELSKKGFPDSYIDDLVKLHNKYPNWKFEPLDTGLNWTSAVNGERRTHRQQLIENHTSLYPQTYFCKCADCYKNGKYVVRESPNWVSASREAVEHYMDPRNFLDEKHIFQFESTAYDSSQTQSGVEAILNGTWMHNSNIAYKDAKGKSHTIYEKYSAVIMNAAKTYNMSAYYLASKIVQEVGGKSATAGGASGTNKTYPGIYNYYNIGAYTGALDGLKWASTSSNSYYINGDGSRVNVRQKPVNGAILVSLPDRTKVTYKSSTAKQSDGYVWKCISFTYGSKSYTGYVRSDLLGKSSDTYGRPWSNPKLSILYGAKYISNNFKTQTSGYLQKFNVSPKSQFLHQNEYMANVAAAVTESEKTYTAYNKIGKLSAAKTFQIPVFDNMPDGDTPNTSYFTALVGIANGFDLHWSRVDNTTGYQIQYATKRDFSNAATIYAGPRDTTSKTITGRAANTKYYVRIRTYKTLSADNRIWGNWSQYDEVTTTSVTSPPSPTQFTSLTQAANGFNLNWMKISDADGYQLQYATKYDFSNCAAVNVKTNDDSKTITGRAAGTKYYVRIRAYKVINGSNSYGKWSPAQSITTPSRPKTAIISSVKGISKGFTVNWGRVSDTTGYHLQCATKSDFSNAATIYAGPRDTTSKTVTGRAFATKYYVRVRTYKNIKNSYVWGKWSEAEAVMTSTKPSATSFTSAAGVKNGFSLKWNKVPETTGYQIQYATKSDFSNCATIYAGPTNTTSKTITGRAARTKYYVRIRTYRTLSANNRIWGNWSSSKSIATK